MKLRCTAVRTAVRGQIPHVPRAGAQGLGGGRGNAQPTSEETAQGRVTYSPEVPTLRAV